MPSIDRLVLASASPRRVGLLESLGLSFAVVPSGIDEQLAPGLLPHEQAVRLALAKAEEVRSRQPGCSLIAADTLVVLDGRVLMKPADCPEAAGMLRALRGREHRVVTGVSADGESGWRATSVLMRPYSDGEIDAYIATGDPMDKAGAYAIQHPVFRPVERIEGCYCNVVGLPLGLVRDLLGLDAPRPTPCEGCPDWSC